LKKLRLRSAVFFRAIIIKTGYETVDRTSEPLYFPVYQAIPSIPDCFPICATAFGSLGIELASINPV
jgi:hypothetical protein